MSETNTLAAALLAAQRDIEGIYKDSVNSFHKYRYASGEGVVTAARSVLHRNGLTVSRHRVRIVMVGDFYMIQGVMRLTHESGESRNDTFMFPVVPDKARPLDKATAGSLTTSLGYYLRDLLCVPRTDEQVEVCERDDRCFVPASYPPRDRAILSAKGWTGIEDKNDLKEAVAKSLAAIGYTVVDGQSVPDETWVRLYDWIRGNSDKDFRAVLNGGQQNGRLDKALLGDME